MIFQTPLKEWVLFIGLEKSYNQLIFTNKMKTDHPCDLKVWLMYCFTIIVLFMQKESLKTLEYVILTVLLTAFRKNNNRVRFPVGTV